MNKTITLCILQLLQTVFSIAQWMALAAIWHKVQYKSLRGFWMHMGVRRPEKGAFLRGAKTIGTAYLFTIAMYVILKFVNGGMTASALNRERETVPLPILLIMVLLVGFRSGFGEELFFRGAVGNWFFDKLGAVKGNLLQALIFALPHIWTYSRLARSGEYVDAHKRLYNGPCPGAYHKKGKRVCGYSNVLSWDHQYNCRTHHMVYYVTEVGLREVAC